MEESVSSPVTMDGTPLSNNPASNKRHTRQAGLSEARVRVHTSLEAGRPAARKAEETSTGPRKLTALTIRDLPTPEKQRVSRLVAQVNKLRQQNAQLREALEREREQYKSSLGKLKGEHFRIRQQSSHIPLIVSSPFPTLFLHSLSLSATASGGPH